MIFANNELIDITKSNIHALKYKEMLYRVLESGEFDFPIVIKTRPAPLINPTGIRESPQNMYIPASSVLTDGHGSVEWRYSEGLPQVINGVFQYPTRYIFIPEVLMIEKKDVDLAIFLLFLSEHGVRTGNLYVENPKKEADEYAAKRAVLSGVTFILYDEESPLDDESVITLAKAYGISVENRTINQIKKEIEEMVIRGETTGDPYINYKTFKSHVRMGDVIKMQGRIYDWYKEGKIEYAADEGAFYSLDAEGKRVHRLLKINLLDSRRKDSLLAKHLLTNTELLELLGEGQNVHTIDFNVEELRSLSFDALKAIAKRHGYGVFGKSKEELIRILEEVARKATE